jgi:PleD family two-component response regulator
VAVAQRIRESFAKAAQDIDGRPVCATVSIGVVNCDGPVFDVPELLAQDDQALNFAKERGRNRVELATLDMLINRQGAEPAIGDIAAAAAKSAA